MRVAVTSDTHLGLTKDKTLKKMFKAISEQSPDLLIHAGDYCGGFSGSKSVLSTIKLIREAMPTIPIVSVLGNHDYWCCTKVYGEYVRPSDGIFAENLKSIQATFKTYKVHFLDEDGVYRHPDFEGYAFVGHTGWYHDFDPSKPKSNDSDNMPPSKTDLQMLSTATRQVLNNLDELCSEDTQRIFISHFPVVEPRDWGWSEGFGKILQSDVWDIKHIIGGHMHRLRKGPVYFEAGSDYYAPKYLLLNL